MSTRRRKPTTPWPSVKIDGQLENAEREWLHTNAAGAYAMSTLALMHTRRYHGLLVAALDPPLDRHVVLSHMEAEIQVNRRHYQLSTHRFPSVAPTPGFRLLQRFDQDPLPRWTFRLGRHRLERSVCLIPGQNAVLIATTWFGNGPALLRQRPLMPFRELHQLTCAHGGMLQRVTMRPGEVEIQPVHSMPPVLFGHDGLFVGSPEWYRAFEYVEDKRRFDTSQEDLWTPGTFETKLEPKIPSYIVVAVEDLPEHPAPALFSFAHERLAATDPGPDRSLTVRRLAVAADCFSADQSERSGVLAGYPWYGLWTRDLLQALPGVYLARGEVDSAKRALRGVIDSMREGLVPRRLLGTPAARVSELSARAQVGDVRETELGAVEFAAADPTLLLFEVARFMLRFVDHTDEFVQKDLFPALKRAFDAIRRGRRKQGLWLSDEGLVITGKPGIPLTWMDARIDGVPVTPRTGAAVELQGYWSRGCRTVAELANELGDARVARLASSAGEACRAAFRRRFWCEEAAYPFDCVSEAVAPEQAWADGAIRPNAVLALAADRSLFHTWQAAAIIKRARRDLLTPVGLRSLAPDEPGFRGDFGETFEDRQQSYHQGAVWAHLLGALGAAELEMSPGDFEVEEELRAIAERAVREGPVLGHIPQVWEGEAPHRAAGAPAQATSCAALLWLLAVELRL